MYSTLNKLQKLKQLFSL